MIDYDEVDHFIYRRIITKLVPSDVDPSSIIVDEEEEIVEEDDGE